MSSLSRVQGELASIATQLETLPCPYVNPVAVRNYTETFEIAHEYDGWTSWLSKNVTRGFWKSVNCIASLFGKEVAVESPKVESGDGLITSHYFQTVFGSKKVTWLDHYYKSDIRNLFLHVADLTWSDLQELFQEFQNLEHPTVRFLSEEETAGLRSMLVTYHSVDALSAEHLHTLVDILCPFQKVNHIFLNHVPTQRRFATVREKFFAQEARAKRVFISHSMRHLPTESALWESYLGKDLPSLKLPVGSILLHQNGLYRVFHEINGKGAFKFLLKNYGAQSSLNIVLYRGTIATHWESLKENVCIPNGGMRGHAATLDETSRYLRDPSLGFVSAPSEPVRGIGYSKGSAQLAQLVQSPEIQNEFRRFTSICGLGISFESAAALAGKFQTYKQPPHIRHIWENGDVVHEFGQAHPGLNLAPSTAFVEQLTLYDEGEDQRCLKRMLKSEKHFVQAALFTYNLVVWGHHTRDVIGRTIFFKTVTNETKKGAAILDKRLLCDPVWESGRNFAHYVFSPVVDLVP